MLYHSSFSSLWCRHAIILQIANTKVNGIIKGQFCAAFWAVKSVIAMRTSDKARTRRKTTYRGKLENYALKRNFIFLSLEICARNVSHCDGNVRFPKISPTP